MIEVEVEDAAWAAALPDAETLVQRAAEAALAGAEGRGALTVLLADDAAVRELNARFRGKDAATNVLSFPAPDMPGLPPEQAPLGDVALAYGVCAGEAVAQAKPLAAHLQHLVAHGVLHLLGYDHESEAQAEEMEGLEREIMAALGWPDPYALPPD